MRISAYRFLTAMVLAVIFASAGCGDDDSAPTAPAGKSFLRVGYLSPDAGRVDILLDGEILVPDVIYTGFSAIFELGSGTLSLRITPADQNENIIAEIELTFATGRSYEAVVTGLIGDGTVAVTVLDDDLVPDADNATVRFVHASPGTPNVDITLPDGSVL